MSGLLLAATSSDHLEVARIAWVASAREVAMIAEAASDREAAMIAGLASEVAASEVVESDDAVVSARAVGEGTPRDAEDCGGLASYRERTLRPGDAEGCRGGEGDLDDCLLGHLGGHRGDHPYGHPCDHPDAHPYGRPCVRPCGRPCDHHGGHLGHRAETWPADLQAC